jgi:hypothetical protein
MPVVDRQPPNSVHLRREPPASSWASWIGSCPGLVSWIGRVIVSVTIRTFVAHVQTFVFMSQHSVQTSPAPRGPATCPPPRGHTETAWTWRPAVRDCSPTIIQLQRCLWWQGGARSGSEVTWIGAKDFETAQGQYQLDLCRQGASQRTPSPRVPTRASDARLAFQRRRRPVASARRRTRPHRTRNRSRQSFNDFFEARRSHRGR